LGLNFHLKFDRYVEMEEQPAAPTQ